MAGSPASRQGVFISYRRADTRADAGRLYDRLAARFGGSRVFMDIDDILPGQNFEAVLQETLDNCSLLLVLIGPDWTRAAGVDGSPRLHEESDLVRREVAIALGRGIPVIPLLFNKADMPTASQLPPDLADLAQLQAHEISDARFHGDVSALIDVMAPLLEDKKEVLTQSPDDADETLTTVLPVHSRRSRLPLFASLALVAVAVLWYLNPLQRLLHSEAPDEAPEVEILSLRAEPAQVNDARLLEILVENKLFDARRNPGGAGTSQLLDLVLVGEQAVIVDNSTGLMWQRSATGGQRSLADIELQLRELNEDGFAGYSDWRLPTIDETLSLLTPQKRSGAHISPLLSPAETPIIWTADRAGEQTAWVVYVYDGTATPESLQFNAWLRAVRSHR